MFSGLIQLMFSANCMPGSLVLKGNSIHTERANAASVTTSEMTLYAPGLPRANNSMTSTPASGRKVMTESSGNPI